MAFVMLAGNSAFAAPLVLPLNTWVKLSPLTNTPPSPRLGYEGACVWDSKHQVMIRYGGHNQGGGGEQHSEIWTFDPRTAKWMLKEPNVQPPGICCGQQNVFDPVQGRYLRFPSFSGSHGWQWWREIYLNDSSVWSYDLAENKWRNLRPIPTAQPKPLRCATWDDFKSVVVLFGGETSNEGTLVYDSHLNAWTHQKPSPQPEFRSGGNMAYDAARRRHILFGAQFNNDPHTWAYSLADNRWTSLQPAQLPPTDKNDAVLAYDSVNQIVLVLVRVAEGKEENAKARLETWMFDTGANQWTKLNPPREPDVSGSRARNLAYAPELNAFLLENRTHPPSGPAEQQVWALRLGGTRTGEAPSTLKLKESLPASAPARPRLVEDITVSVVAADRVELAWKQSTEPGVVGYHVERAAVEVATEDQLHRLKRQTAPLAEPSVGAITKVGPFQRITHTPVKPPSYTDTAVDLQQPQPLRDTPLFERKFNAEQFDPAGKPYRFAVFAYRVLAVTDRGAESGASAAEFTIPSPVQWLFAKEASTTCHLKWAANAEKSLRGYRVYRMNGRYDKDPIPRLTPEPVAATMFTDPEAGKNARRYYVVAVDALGQEGFPSSPVWFEREWKPFYMPFTGEWHQ
ncbi:MAG: hypothetical protein FJ406_10200 [Verrucomicrobia bacterium]|nr:hypothetical protein [Verrucomicrobiota bacterium]